MLSDMTMPKKPEMEEEMMEDEMEDEGMPSAVDLSSVSDEDLMAEAKARGLV